MEKTTEILIEDFNLTNHFSTKKDEWTEHEFMPADFVPTFRGRTPSNAPPLKNLQIYQIGFLISEKQSGSFRLRIDWIKVIVL